MKNSRLDLNLLKKIVRMDQLSLYNFLHKELSKSYTLIDTDGKDKRYLFCVGDLPVMMVAHLDTVFEQYTSLKKGHLWDDYLINQIDIRDKVIYHDKEEQVMWSPEGLGADDRVGVFMILSMVRQGLRPSILFTTDEESGSASGGAFAQRYRKSFHKYGIKYLLELDRSGHNDCVFYKCKNDTFKSYIEKFGFKTALGSFTDISVLCPILGVAGTNISVGYFNEHSFTEMIDLFTMSKNYDIIYYMVKESIKIKEPYIYMPPYHLSNNIIPTTPQEVLSCSICNHNMVEYVYAKDFGRICLECFSELYQ